MSEKLYQLYMRVSGHLQCSSRKRKIPYGSDVWYGFDNEKNFIYISRYVILLLITPVIEHFSRFLDNLYVSFCKMPFCALYFFFFFLQNLCFHIHLSKSTIFCALWNTHPSLWLSSFVFTPREVFPTKNQTSEIDLGLSSENIVLLS